MRKLLFSLFVLCSFLGYSTHNRAGEILYKRIAPFTTVVGGITVQVYTYSFTIVKYTDDGPNVADRCEDTLYFGDGERGVASRINGPLFGCGCGANVGCGQLTVNDPDYKVKKNIYTIIHTYAGPGNYLVRSLDPNRNEGVHNIPNSVNLPFYIESMLIINSFTGANSSPTFSFEPTDRACLNKCFYHNPGAFDVDGDSLSYEITTSRGPDGATITGYFFPETGGGTYGINPNTGLLSWCTPQFIGEYNLAFIVKEWRKNTSGIYQLVGYVLRDMQVIVKNCLTNNPPSLKLPIDTCVEAGTLIDKQIEVTDPDNGNFVIVTGGGGSFASVAPISSLNPTSGNTPYFTNYKWQTTCNHIRKQPYSTVFKAEDQQLPTKLVYFGTYNIRVVPPSVKDLTANPIGSSIKVNWSLSTCNPTNNPIVAYKVYRKSDCNPIVLDPCKSGIDPASGFEYIGQTVATGTTLTDDNNGLGLVVGQDYSYLVIALYSDGSQSYASTQVCAKLKRDVPILLNVDVLSTAASNGSVFVRWARPLKTNGNFDTIVFPGPYQFNLKHRIGNAGTYSTVLNSTKNFLYQLDTSFVHNSLNTIDNDHEYLIEFIAGSFTVGSSQKASSVFLTAIAGDRKVNLQWTASTPWKNDKYTVYRKDPGAVSFNTIAVTSNTTYVDQTNLANRSTYCYLILSEGQYSDPNIFKPLLNHSQEICATPKDVTSPCTPSVNITSDCSIGFVKIEWNNVALSCSDDVIKYVLFKKETVDAEYLKVDTLYGSKTTSYTFDGLNLISSCFAVQSIDSSGNASALSADFCVDNCPEFELPNIITINNDGVNDFFKAIKVRQIKEIDLYIYDRWGNLVYKTKDPYFKWDGKSIISKQIVSDGTFFYLCDVYEPRVTGIKKRSLKGYMQVVR